MGYTGEAALKQSVKREYCYSVVPSRRAALRPMSERDKRTCFNPGWQPLSERSERSGWYPSAHPPHSLRSFSGCHPSATRPASERKRPYMSLRRSAATAAISIPAVEGGPVLLGAESRNLVGSYTGLSDRDRIPPLFVPEGRSGRNDKILI